MRFNRRHRIRGWVAGAATVGLLLSVASMSEPGTIEAEGPIAGGDEVVTMVQAQQAVRPQLPTVVPFALQANQSSEPISAEAVEERVRDAWRSRRLGSSDDRAVVVADAINGDVLVDIDGDEPLTPASLTKVISAAAIMSALPQEHTFTTRVVPGATAQDIVLVAGGDQLLTSGRSNPRAVVGRAGLSTLASRTANALQSREGSGAGDPVRVWLDTTYADGPSRAPQWTDFWLDNGFAGRITMLGLEESRALPSDPSPRDPAMVAAASFVDSLEEQGIEVVSEEIERVEAPAEPALAEVESAPARDVLALALATSDNAMIEQLSRQAALADGAEIDQESVNAWVLSTVTETYGISTDGAVLADTSGLSDGTQVPMSLIAETLMVGANGRHPALQSALAGLPIAGLSGTLTDRFAGEAAISARGVVRAKTGSLPQVASLAGTLSTEDGQMLVFAVSTNDVGGGAEGVEARAAIDRMIADLAACGC
ncbi:MAG: D-alanyl-D-alanine carboxypeptidase [Ornithinimicrobium sp.]